MTPFKSASHCLYWAVKTEHRKKQEAKEGATKSLLQTKKRLGVGPAKRLRSEKPSLLMAKRWKENLNQPQPRPPGPAPADDFTHAHKWKRGVREDATTVKELRLKASKIAPRHNKGALQYLPDEKDG